MPIATASDGSIGDRRGGDTIFLLRTRTLSSAKLEYGVEAGLLAAPDHVTLGFFQTPTKSEHAGHWA